MACAGVGSCHTRFGWERDACGGVGVGLVESPSPGAPYSESYLHARIIGLFGGRAAEQIVYDEVTTGAESDLEQATALARQMVGRWGMSEQVGPVSALPGPGEERFILPGAPCAASPRTLELIDDEVRRLTEEGLEHAIQMLTEHRAQLDTLAVSKAIQPRARLPPCGLRLVATGPRSPGRSTVALPHVGGRHQPFSAERDFHAIGWSLRGSARVFDATLHVVAEAGDRERDQS